MAGALRWGPNGKAGIGIGENFRQPMLQFDEETVAER